MLRSVFPLAIAIKVFLIFLVLSICEKTLFVHVTYMWHDLIYIQKFRNLFSHSSGVQKRKQDVCRAMLPLKLWEDPSRLFLASSWLLVAQLLSHVWLFEVPRTEACQSSLFVEFSQQECWSGLPFPPPGDLPHSGIKPTVTWEAPYLHRHDIYLPTHVSPSHPV